MVKRIEVEKELIEKIEKYLKNHNLGNRGFEDGNSRKQKVGLIGELVVYKYLKGEFPDLNDRADGFDSGFNIKSNGKLIDVKTMERSSYVRPNFVNNFYLIQESHLADTIAFCSFNSVSNILEICGCIPKNELAKRGIFYAAGTTRVRTDGTSFKFRQDNYEVENKDLDDIDILKD